MDLHRRVEGSSITCFKSDPPFSCFDWTETHLSSPPEESIRRCFSLARSLMMQAFCVEDVPATGMIQDENEELEALHPDYTMRGLKRLSFWTGPVPGIDVIDGLGYGDLLGYAIVKQESAHGQEKRRGFTPEQKAAVEFNDLAEPRHPAIELSRANRGYR